MQTHARFFVVAIAIVAAACGESEVEATASRTAYSERIVGGEVFTGMPAVGAITWDGQHMCTGTLIEARKVLTAGHCVDGTPVDHLKFVIGPSITNAEHALTVVSGTAHPNFDYNNITNDIAFLTLSADAPVAPMPILNAMDSSFVGKDLLFVGYGVTNGVTNAGVGVKRAVSIKLSQVNSTTFRYDDPKKNTCGGDSGGPAFYQNESGEYFIAGVTSYGDWACREYGVDTRVDVYKDFLGVSEPVDPCHGESFAGRCNGSTVVWCEFGQVQTLDCGEYGMACGWDEEHGYFNCMY